MTRVHFIGIGGAAMATLAAMLQQRGFTVRGSDQEVYPPMREFLAREGIEPLRGYRAEHITDDLDLVVVGNAVSRDNPEIEAVLDRKLRYASLPEVLRDQFLWTTESVVIAGTHGKTTTAALTAWLLAYGGADPTMLVGGVAQNFDSSYRLGSGRQFVVEGDEYDSAFFDKTAKFLKYLPDVAVIANVEFDHADIYPDLDAVRVAFKRLVTLVPRRGLVLLGADHAEAMALREQVQGRVETFGFSDTADWRADRVTTSPDGTTFRVWRGAAVFLDAHLPQLGDYNVRNALAAIAVGARVGLGAATLADGLQRFKGVRRRLEVRGTVSGVTVYDDFAHHPTAVAETLAAVRAAHPDRRLWAIFEPRSASACRRIFQREFAEALSGADQVLLPAVYRASIPEDQRLAPEQIVETLSAAGVRARYVPDLEAIVALVAREARAGDLVVVMSNGAFGGIHEKLLHALAPSASRER